MKRKLNVTAGGILLPAALYFLLPTRGFIALILAAAFHELGHLLAIILTGQKVSGASADAKGALIKTSGSPSNAEQATVAAAGPAMGIVYAVLASRFDSPLLLTSSGMSVVLSAFNMIPALPLDGGRITEAALGERASAAIGLAASVLTLAGGVVLAARGDGFALLIAGAWLCLAQTGL